MTQDLQILLDAENPGAGGTISPMSGQHKAFSRLHKAGFLQQHPSYRRDYRITEKGRERLANLRAALYA